MKLSIQPYKGARDFYPEDKRLQKYMFNSMRRSVERYGYEEYDAPMLESLDLYLAKTGEEIVGEQTYSFKDRGGRDVVIRPEMTPSVSRMVAARRQELSYPLRWYSIPNLWRYERPQRGRFREHWQLNVDVFGMAGTEAEIEIVSIANQIFKDFGATADSYEIRLNSRLFMDHVLKDYLSLSEQEAHGIAKLIDRMHKLERTAFIAQADALCSPKAKEAGVIEKLLAVLETKSIRELPKELRNVDAVQKLEAVLEQLTGSGISNVVFDVTLMRGFDYYTDIIFEVFDTHPDNNRSMLGGGRYDGLVGLFGVSPIPTVGFGLGDATLANFLTLHHLLPAIPSETDLYIALVGELGTSAAAVIAELRKLGLNLATDFSGRKIGDQLKAAAKKNIPWVVIIGTKELETNQFTLKNLATGDEQALELAALATAIMAGR